MLRHKHHRLSGDKLMVMRSPGSRPGTRGKMWPVLAVFLWFVVLFTTAGCEKEKPTAAAPPPPDVLVAEVVQQDVPIYSEWLGTTDGSVNAQIRARVQGYLESRDY